MTSIKRTLLIGASSLAIVLTAASAGATSYGGGSDTDIDIDDSFNKKTEITKIDDSFNTKTDVDVDVRKDDHSINDSFNSKTDIDVTKINTDIDVRKDDHSIDDSFNTKTEDSNNTKIEDSYNKSSKVEDSYNKKDSHDVENSFNTMKMSFDNRKSEDNDKFILKGKDVTASVLEGTVANNSVAIKMGNHGKIEGNFIGDYVQQNADGVNMNLQNVGSNSNNQQSVAIRADVYNTDNLDMGSGSRGGHGSSWGSR